MLFFHRMFSGYAFLRSTIAHEMRNKPISKKITNHIIPPPTLPTTHPPKPTMNAKIIDNIPNINEINDKNTLRTLPM